MSESVVLCEGYHDRAFWAGWLTHVGLTDPGQRPEGAERVPVLDPWGKKVVGGQFGFLSKTGHFVRVEPCNGDIGRILQVARKRLDRESQSQRQGASELGLRQMVLNIDADVEVEEASPKKGFSLADLCSWLWELRLSPDATETDVLLFGGATTVSLVRWRADDPHAAGIPSKQTLERLVCAAIVAAYPERGEPLERWLDSRPNEPPAGPKHFACSHMAGWYPEFGSDGFYRRLWEEPAVVEQLELRLKACGAWQIAEELAK